MAEGPTIFIEVKADDSQAQKALKSTDKTVTDLGDNIASMGEKLFFAISGFEKLLGIVKSIVQPALTFNQALTRSVIAMDDSSVTIGVLEKKFKALADGTLDGLYSYQEVANAFLAIADEGRGLAGTLGYVEEAMYLAAATGASLVELVARAETITDAFNLSMEDTQHIMDVLITTMRGTGASIEEIAQGFTSIGQVAGAVGLTMEEVGAILGVLKNRGVDQINGLLVGFQQMASGMGYAKRLTDEYEVAMFNADGTLRSMIEVMVELGEKGVSNARIFTAFGVRSSKAMVAFLNNLGEINEVAHANADSFNEAREAGEFYADSDAAKAEKLAKAYENLVLTLSQELLPVIMEVIEIIRPLVDLMADNIEIIWLLISGFIAWKTWLILTTMWAWLHVYGTVAMTLAHHGLTLALVLTTAAAWAATIGIKALNLALWAFPLIILIWGFIELEKRTGLLTAAWEGFAGAIGAVVDWLGGLAALAGDAVGGWEVFLEEVLEPILDILESIIEALDAVVEGVKAATGQGGKGNMFQQAAHNIQNLDDGGWENTRVYKGTKRMYEGGEWAVREISNVGDTININGDVVVNEDAEDMAASIRNAAIGRGGRI